MAIFELEQKPNHGPYSALIGTDTDFESGQIRIEPPFNPGKFWLEMPKGDGIHLEHVLTTRESTIIDYAMPDAGDSFDDNLEKIANEMGSLFQFLGQSASKTAFTKYWNSF